ncbi:MAG TPA: serine/threonine-protein kinase, partial [Planctomycetota bacterium]|nr:serine/threonine-protein kinase [Planctomycetota bacterium]
SRQRFLREARTVARLRHANIVAVYAAGAAERTLYFVMEYVDGESVRQRLERDGAWRGPGAVAALRDLARALAYAHAHGIVHRDVKPENILVERDTGRALLTDFGVAQALAGGDESGRMTATGMVIGSPFYMSPEQAAGERALDGRSDIYSLGLVGYEMLAGAPVVQATSAATAIMKQLTERATALRLRAPDAPPAVADAIDRALEKDPANRWPDASAFADALDAGRSGTPVPPTTVLPAARPARRFAPLGLALAVLVLVLGGWWLLGRRGRLGTVAGTSRNSYLVAPFEVLTGDPQVGWLREGSVSMLSLSLSQWTDLSVVDYERSLDLLREAKVGESARVSLEDARGMARHASVGTVVMGQITNTRDSLRVVARTYDVATGRKLDEAERAAAAGADPRPVFDALAGDLLDLAGAPAG